MNVFNVFVAIIILVVSILQVIFIFKIWQMTNDTAEIKSTLKIMLHRKLTIEKRKEKMIEKVVESLKITDYHGSNIYRIETIVARKIEEHKRYIEGLFEIYDLSELYTFAELSEDMKSSILAKNKF